MKHGTGQRSDSGNQLQLDIVAIAAIAAVLLYAGVAGYRTVSEPDLHWQLREARYLVETGHIASRDVFSYTASGQPWRYPQGAGLIFYGLYRVGGYPALTWLGVLACMATAGALLAVRPGLLASALTALAVPLIAWRTNVRAELFTTVLFAFSLLFLLRGTALRHRWLLPVMAVLWVNLHGAFVLFFALIGMSLLAALLGRKRAATGGQEFAQQGSLMAALSVGGFALLATLLNPFGPAVWLVPFEQGAVARFHSAAVAEWGPSVWSVWRVMELLEWRDPDGAYWVLLFLGAFLVLWALWRRDWLVVFVIVSLAAASLHALRLQALFGIAVVAMAAHRAPAGRIRQPIRLAVLAILLVLAGVRVSDLATNRYYFSHSNYTSFGSGLSYVFPERAAEFILKQRLPGRLLQEAVKGGFVSWELGPAYPVFIDSRLLPFGSDLLLENVRAFGLDPHSPEWHSFIARWGIRTIVVDLDRHNSFAGHLRKLCGASDLRLVYVDEIAAVFLTNVPENKPWLDRLALDCSTAQIAPAGGEEPAYLYHAQAVSVYRQLGQIDKAWAECQLARRYFTDDPQLHVSAAQMLSSVDAGAARRELMAAASCRESARAWHLLGLLEAGQGRHREAIDAFLHATRTERYPCEAWLAIAKSRLALGEPAAALRGFEQALSARESLAGQELLGPAFFADAYAGLARARFMMGDVASAEAALRAAAASAPREPVIQLMLAEFYLGQGRRSEARAALQQATALGASGPILDQLQEKIGRDPARR